MATKGWLHRIKAARKQGEFTALDREDAGGWMTCAVGEMSKRTNFHPWDVIDYDKRLEDLGVRFTNYVQENKFGLAERAYRAIKRHWSVPGLTRKISKGRLGEGLDIPVRAYSSGIYDQAPRRCRR